MMGLTTKQAELLKFIETYQAEHRAAPSFVEMGEAVGCVKSGIHRLLKGLEERHHIRRRPYRVRAIEIVNHHEIARTSSTELVSELERRGYRVNVCPNLLRKAA